MDVGPTEPCPGPTFPIDAAVALNADSISRPKAARIIETMEKNGIVSQANHVGKREIL